MERKESDLRREAEKAFVSDHFFEKGHLLNKLHVSLWVIIGWIAMVVPIYWTVTSTLLRKQTKPVWNYGEGIKMYYTFNWLFLIAFGVILVTTILLTYKNNRKTKKELQKEILYDQGRLHKREHVYDDLMTARFGNEKEREAVRFYTVPEEKNLDTDTISQAYEKAGVKL